MSHTLPVKPGMQSQRNSAPIPLQVPLFKQGLGLQALITEIIEMLYLSTFVCLIREVLFHILFFHSTQYTDKLKISTYSLTGSTNQVSFDHEPGQQALITEGIECLRLRFCS